MKILTTIPVVSAVACAASLGQLVQYEVKFEEEVYASGSQGKVIISPVPPEGLFSFGVLARIQGQNLTGWASFAPVDLLDHNGLLSGPATTTASTSSEVGAKGSLAISGLGATGPGSLSQEIGTFDWSNLPTGQYTVTLESFTTLGSAEQIWLTKGCEILDNRITFGHAQIGSSITGTAVGTENPALDNQSGLFLQTINLTNVTGGRRGNFRIFVEDLPAETELWNAHGEEGGVPYIDYISDLDSGASINLVLEFYNPTRMTPAPPTLSVHDASGVTSTPDASNPIDVDIRAEFQSPGGALLIEFSTESDKSYIIQYSSGMTTWSTVPGFVPGNGSRVQWIDNGPPKTDCHPMDCSGRVYRVLEANE